MEQVRYGIIGIGNMGSSHLKNFFAGRFGKKGAVKG